MPNVLQRLFARRQPEPPAAPPAPQPTPAAPLSFSGRPTYAPLMFGAASAAGGMRVFLPRDTSLQFLAELYRTIPVMKEAVCIYSGFVGTPCIVGETDAETERFEEWRDSVPVGAPGAGTTGLTAFLADHLGQALLFGYAVGECGIPEARNGVARLISYASPAFRFESDAAGNVVVVQWQQFGTGTHLNPETTLVSTLDPQGSDPNGQPLFAACPTVGQIWAEALYSHRSNWRRTGDVRFHVNWKPPPTFNDPQGTTAARVREEMEASWNAAMHAAITRGEVLDYYSTGDITIEVIGSDGPMMDLQVSKRQLMEEVVVASGIPPFLFGYMWATTERMSEVQAQKFTERVASFRRMLEPGIRKVVDLEMRLSGRVRPYTVSWPDLGINELVDTSIAAFNDARAANQRLAYATGLWRAGIWSQEQAADYLTGLPVVAVPMAEPPALPTGAGGGSSPIFDQQAADDAEARWKRLMGEDDAADYGFPAGAASRNGHAH